MKRSERSVVAHIIGALAGRHRGSVLLGDIPSSSSTPALPAHQQPGGVWKQQFSLAANHTGRGMHSGKN